jgi:hypothetical protein
MLEKIKLHATPVFFIVTIVLSGTLGFGLGRLSRLEEGREPVRIVDDSPVVSTQAKAVTTAGARGNYVASKNGTKYYLLGCAGVSRIKEENKVYFATKEAAEKAGLGPAANCPGI